jgi:inosine-uridine nucleoside N-ribohydrolase
MKLIIDTDVGSDDACALILALSHPKVDVLALTTVFGNVPLKQAVANASRIRKLVQRENVPIYAGAIGPLISTVVDGCCSKEYHGEDGLGDAPDTFPIPDLSDFDAHVPEKHAAQAIIDLARSTPGCTILCLGPLTNLALALKLDPHLGHYVKHLFLMGGNCQAVGNVPTSYTAEYNFYKDPEAAHIVLSDMHCPITAIPWEMYLSQSCSKEFVEAYTRNEITKKSRFVKAILQKPLTKLESLQLSYSLCDELATAVAIDPSIILASENRYYASVELHGLYTRGQVAIDRRNCSGRKPNIEFVTKVDLGKAERMMLESLEESLFMNGIVSDTILSAG